MAGDKSVVFVEAKLSPEGTGRGPDGTRVGQMHLRRQFFDRWGTAIYGDIGKLVLGICLSGKVASDSGPDEKGVAVRSLTWANLASYKDHPNGDEFAYYLDWKLENSPEAQQRLAATPID